MLIIRKDTREKYLPTRVEEYVKVFVVNMSRYAQKFSNEVCESCGEYIISELNWAPIMYFKKNKMMETRRSKELKNVRQNFLQCVLFNI